ncbi:MAG: hypothetical protein H7X99_05280 [Saprospiraceae bacterium]|nr:hypothetical protein [Saprospiraceae bacterium]
MQNKPFTFATLNLKMTNFPIKVILFVVICFFVVFMSCSKNETVGSLFPGTYRYNSPNLYEKHIFAIDTLTKKIKIITDTLGSFNRANSEISDSINRIIEKEFLILMLRSIEFTSSDDAILSFARLDTIGTDTLIPTSTENSKYSLSGNQIIFDARPEYRVDINNSFLELNYCHEFTLRSQSMFPAKSIKRYSKRLCDNFSPTQTITNIINDNPGVRYDTISLEYVNYIFSKY